MAQQSFSAHTRPPPSSPLLGLYFGILSAVLAAIVLVLVILEQLGMPDRTLGAAMLAGPVALFAAVGVIGFTRAPAEFFHAGRRVPAFFAGLVLAVVALGGTGFMALCGAVLLSGFDALSVLLGLVAGFVVMAVAVAPFMRKFGAPSLPTYLGQRFESAPVRILGASVAVGALLLLAIAELKAAALAAGWLAGLSPGAATALVVLVLAVTLLPGGVRSLTWSSSAQAIAAFAALLVPVAIVAVMVTYLPLPQVSHGPLLRAMARAETQGALVPLAPALAFELPGDALSTLSSRFATPFTSVGSIAFVLAALAVAAGIAASPVLLPRTKTTVSVYETRKAVGWTVFLVGATIMTFSAVAVFTRDLFGNTLAGLPIDRLPEGFRDLAEHGLVALDGAPQRISMQALQIRRDAALIALPTLFGLPTVLVHFVALGILAAALAAAGASLVQLAVVLADDVTQSLLGERPSLDRRMLAIRVALAGVLVIVGLVAWTHPGDPLTLLLWSLVLSGSGLFPVLVLSIWWKRINAAGALTAMGVGTGIALLAFVAQALDVLGGNAVLAATVAVPSAIVAAIVASHLTPAPDRHILEMVRDLRIPGGEAISDRETRREVRMRRVNG